MYEYCLALGLCIKGLYCCCSCSLLNIALCIGYALGIPILIGLFVGSLFLFGSLVGHPLFIFLTNIDNRTNYISYNRTSFHNDVEFYQALFGGGMMGFLLEIGIVMFLFFFGLWIYSSYKKSLQDAKLIIKEEKRKNEEVRLEIQRNMRDTSFRPESSSSVSIV
jgi:hypothetical protein